MAPTAVAIYERATRHETMPEGLGTCISGLLDNAFSGEFGSQYASVLRDLAYRERFRIACIKASQLNGEGDPSVALGDLGDIVKDGTPSRGFMGAKDLVLENMGGLLEELNSQNEIQGIDTGYKELNSITRGWKEGAILETC